MSKFSFKIVNAGGSDKVVCLLPGTLPTRGLDITEVSDVVTEVAEHYHDPQALKDYGLPVDATLDDGIIYTDITVTAMLTKHKVRHFLAYIQKFPQVVSGLTIEASNKDVFEEIITIRQDSPLKGTDENYILLQEYFGLQQVQDNKVNIVPTRPWPATADALWYMNIPAGRTLKFTFTLRPAA